MSPIDAASDAVDDGCLEGIGCLDENSGVAFIQQALQNHRQIVSVFDSRFRLALNSLPAGTVVSVKVGTRHAPFAAADLRCFLDCQFLPGTGQQVHHALDGVVSRRQSSASSLLLTSHRAKLVPGLGVHRSLYQRLLLLSSLCLQVVGVYSVLAAVVISLQHTMSPRWLH